MGLTMEEEFLLVTGLQPAVALDKVKKLLHIIVCSMSIFLDLYVWERDFACSYLFAEILMMRNFIFGLAFALSLKAFAAPQMVYVGGAPYVDFGDGRKAVVSHGLGKINHGAMGLRQIENTCDPGQVLSNCRIQLDFASHIVSLRWADHTDKSKIGAIVKIESSAQAYEVKDGGMRP